MSQEVPAGDIIFGAVILVAFLIIALIAGRLLSNFKNRRFTRAWAPLISLVNGKITHDGGGAATSWLTGVYRGQQVQASMIPGRNTYSDQTGPRYNYFDVALLDIPGKQDWRIENQPLILGRGHKGWHIASEDRALEIRLQESGIVTTLGKLGNPTIEYTVRGGILRYSEDVTPRWAPTPERFQEELALLLKLAEIQRSS